MRNHKYIDTFHCEKCFDKCIKRATKKAFEMQPNYYLVSPKQYPYVKKYGLAEGLMKYFGKEPL